MSQNEFGKVFKRAWGDRDFKKLTVEEQLLYIKLLSQPDISLAGVLTYAPVRWATQSAGITVADVERAFAALQQKNYVMSDMETQEVLVRSYIRNDLGWRSPRTMIGVANAVGRVLSPLLRGIISRELTRLDTSGLSDTISEKTNRSTRDVVESTIQGVLDDFPPLDTLSTQPENRVSDTVCDTPTDTLFDTVSGVRAHNDNDNDRSNGRSNDKHTPSPSTDADAPAAKRNTEDKEFDEWYAEYPRKEGKGQARKAYRAARKKTDQSALVAGVARLVAQRLERQFTPLPATWLNGERWLDDLPTPTGPAADEWGPRKPDVYSIYDGDEESYLLHLERGGWTREEGRWTE